MNLLAILFAMLLPTAPGDIYRCIGPDGKAGFQDKPCAGQPKAGKLRQGTAAGTDQRALREWLEQLRDEPPRATTRASRRDAPTPTRTPWTSPATTGEVDERLLSVCSSRFLDCASDVPSRMDACVRATPACGNGRSTNCCPRACVTRYASLRVDGATLAAAVRGALLDPAQPSCAAR